MIRVNFDFAEIYIKAVVIDGLPAIDELQYQRILATLTIDAELLASQLKHELGVTFTVKVI